MEAGKTPSRKSLPPAKLLAADTLKIASDTSKFCGDSVRRADVEVVNSPKPPPPDFAVSMDTFKQRMEGYVGQIALPDKLSNVHPMIAKLIKEDERRIEENRRRGWYW